MVDEDGGSLDAESSNAESNAGSDCIAAMLDEEETEEEEGKGTKRKREEGGCVELRRVLTEIRKRRRKRKRKWTRLGSIERKGIE